MPGTYVASLRSRDMADTTVINRPAPAPAVDIARDAFDLRRFAEPLPNALDPDFAVPFDRFADARIVLLGEATHGTAEFYDARAAVTRRLIEKHGFSIVAVEADWPDADRLDRYVRRREKLVSEEAAFARFPTWMWRNLEVRRFIDWLHQHNLDQPPERRAEFRGLDDYSLRSSMAAVLNYLDEVDPEQARDARTRYACLTPWQDDPARYGYAAIRGASDTCEDEAVDQLTALLELRLADLEHDHEAHFSAVQNARIVRAAEQYYRIMYRGSRESWNLRDRHMFDTLQHLIEQRGPNAKAIVWAHNSHIGDAAATSMGWQGEFNIGELCRAAYGKDAVLIGFGTDRGTVAAAADWDEPVEIMTVLPARADSYEHLFHKTGTARALFDWRQRGRRGLGELLSRPRLQRAIGVVYRPVTELMSHYFQAVLAEQFDAYIWFEETRAVTPFGGTELTRAAETYPFGV
jgi:erythromycin esterase-like protein